MRDYRKFFTYPETAAFMAKLLSPEPNKEYLEPSAGDGALIKAVKQCEPNAIVDAVELDKQWKKELVYSGSRQVFIRDFLDVPLFKNSYDGCIANPPFGNGVDLQAHFNKIHQLVKEGGKIVAIAPAGFNPVYAKNYTTHPLENWSKNSDGTTTEIVIIEFINPPYTYNHD